MNSEENRLCTFDAWPQNAPVEAACLAKAGFFSTGRFLEAQCNWCQCCISDWDYGDDVYIRHASAQPQCPFLVINSNCGNIPLGSNEVPDQATGTNIESQNLEFLHNEANRLATFKNWPNPNISPQSLAKAGFFYLNRADQVKCAWCKGVIAMWEKNDNAFDEHQRFFPDCPRVQLGPLIEMASDGIRDLGIQKITTPKQPKYSSLDARLRTYEKWPIPNIQSPLALAQAGLYYQETNDQVRCFHCNIGLRSWQKEDDPFFEHAKWFPECQFVQLVKGPHYIKEVEEITRKTNEISKQMERNPMSIEEAMTTSPVLQALEIGLDAGAVRNATQKQLISTGQPFITIEDLVNAVFRSPEDETEQRVPDVVYERTPAIADDSSPLCASVTTASAGIEPVNAESNAVNESTGATTSAVAGSNTETPAKQEEKSESSTELALSLEEENRKLKDARLCKVCLDEEVGVVFLPCGHLVTCVQCAPGITLCPMCRKPIKGFVRTFLS